MYAPTISLMHIHHGSRKTTDKSTGRTTNCHCCHTCRMPTEIANIGLIEHKAVGIIHRRNQSSAICHTNGICVQRAIRTFTSFQHFHIDIIAVSACSGVILCKNADFPQRTISSPLVSYSLVAFLPVGKLIGSAVVLAAGSIREKE